MTTAPSPRFRHQLRATALAALLAFAAPAAAQMAGDPVPVTVIRAIPRDVPEYARGIGTVQAWRSVLVRARVDGTLDHIAFTEGQTVHPGDLLAEIDPRPYAAALAGARAKRAADQALLDNARRDLARYENLVRTNIASRQQADTQTALVAQYTANTQADDAAIDTAALNLSFCRIESPIEGVVGLRQVDIGNLIHATDNTGIVTIEQVHPIALLFTLPQDQLPSVRAAMQEEGGHPPVIALASDGHTPLSTGSLVTTNNTIDTQTGTITLKAEFPNTDNKLWPGQFAYGEVQLAIARAALQIPTGAIQHGPDGLYVYIVKPDQTVARRDIAAGYADEAGTVVASGLAPGDIVVLSGQLRLQEGTRVAPTEASGS